MFHKNERKLPERRNKLLHGISMNDLLSSKSKQKRKYIYLRGHEQILKQDSTYLQKCFFF